MLSHQHLRLALENAYQYINISSMHAGNRWNSYWTLPLLILHYPAAYNYVLGVEDNAGYTNYDQDGPLDLDMQLY